MANTAQFISFWFITVGDDLALLNSCIPGDVGQVVVPVPAQDKCDILIPNSSSINCPNVDNLEFSPIVALPGSGDVGASADVLVHADVVGECEEDRVMNAQLISRAGDTYLVQSDLLDESPISDFGAEDDLGDEWGDSFHELYGLDVSNVIDTCFSRIVLLSIHHHHPCPPRLRAPLPCLNHAAAAATAAAAPNSLRQPRRRHHLSKHKLGHQNLGLSPTNRTRGMRIQPHINTPHMKQMLTFRQHSHHLPFFRHAQTNGALRGAAAILRPPVGKSRQLFNGGGIKTFRDCCGAGCRAGGRSTAVNNGDKVVGFVLAAVASVDMDADDEDDEDEGEDGTEHKAGAGGRA
ncbi:hypothetical protein M5K25_025998 [Dendrobium thyrsiflorum]|uniref:Uncharacterized protein n=1 Tax=Dendrobium thyrsiflorum TaxID=117978 RepID=A0ABD0TW67_DENTH